MKRICLLAALALAGCSLPPREVLRDSGIDTGLADLGDAGASDLVGPDAPLTWPARFHVSRGFVRDELGRAVILRGVNLANSHKSKPYLGFHQAADYQLAAGKWGFNALRFLISWSAVEPQKGQYDSAYLDQLALRMDWAGKAGLLVVLDMHQDVYGEGFGFNGAPRWTCDEAAYKGFVPVSPWFLNYSSPQVSACFDALYTSADLGQRYAEAWRQVALRLRHFSNVIGFDPMNEPHWGSYNLYLFEKDRLQPFYNRVVAAVRSAAPGWLAFLEPGNSRNMYVKTSLVPFAFGDTVYAPHSYNPRAEQGEGFDAADRAAYMANIAALAVEAGYLKSALWIGEYGGNPDHKGIAEYMDAAYDGAAAAAGSTMYWAYDRDSGYGLLDSAGKEKAALLDALVRPYPTRVAGDPVTYAFDEKTSTFSLTYRPIAAITAPTLISVPGRVYAKGYQVLCAAPCAYAKLSGDLLQVTTPPAGSPAVVTVKPL